METRKKAAELKEVERSSGSVNGTKSSRERSASPKKAERKVHVKEIKAAKIENDRPITDALQDDRSLIGRSETIVMLIPIVLTILSFGTRFYKIGLSPTVVWDEAQ